MTSIVAVTRAVVTSNLTVTTVAAMPMRIAPTRVTMRSNRSRRPGTFPGTLPGCVCRNAVREVLDCTIRVVESCSQALDDLVSGEAHVAELSCRAVVSRR